MTRRRRMSEASYLGKSERQRADLKRDLAIVDEKELHPERPLTSIFKSHHRDPRAFKRSVPTRHEGGRLVLAPPGERRLYRGRATMLADIDGRPQVVRLTPGSDADWAAIRKHDKAVYAAIVKDDESLLRKQRRLVIVDSETGTRYRFFLDGDEMRDAADTGGFEISDLYYSGRRHSLDALTMDLDGLG